MQNRLFSIPNSLALAICLTALFLFTSQSVAQETTPFLVQIKNSTPEQQINYVIEARKRGYSLLQLESLAKAQGASSEELFLLRRAWSDSQRGSSGWRHHHLSPQLYQEPGGQTRPRDAPDQERQPMVLWNESPYRRRFQNRSGT